MTFFGSIGKKPTERIRIAIDVGTHSIKAIVFTVPAAGTLPRVLKKLVFKLTATLSPIQKVSRLHEFLFNIIRELGIVPEKITIALGPGLVEYDITTWTITKPSGKRGIAKKDVTAIFQRLLVEHQDKYRLIVAIPLEILVNGYALKTDLPSKIPPAEISFRVILLYMPGVMGIALEEIKKSLGGMPINFTTLAACSREAIFRSFGEKEALLVDVGGDESTLVFLKNRTVAEFAFFPAGANDFLRMLARERHIGHAESETLMTQYIQNHLAPEIASSLELILKNAATRWKKSFIDALDMLYNAGPLPQEIYCFGGGVNQPEIYRTISDADWMADRSHITRPSVRILNASDLFGGNSLEGFLQGPEEVGLASLMLYSLYHEPPF
ncbi:MAG: hypothetical protein AAB539_01680 [Patescibacteria group bacterium]